MGDLNSDEFSRLKGFDQKNKQREFDLLALNSDFSITFI